MIEIIEAEKSVQLELFEPTEITRPDMNVGKWAGWLFSSPWARDLYEEKQFQWTTVLGDETLKASLTVRPIKGRKRPTTTTYRMFLALIQIWEQSGRPESGEFHFSARQLAHVLGWRWAGRDTTNRIQEQLAILSGTEIEWGRSFFKGEELETLVEDMKLIDGKSFLKRENSTTRALFTAQHKIRLNRDLVANMIAGKTKPVLYQVFLTIRNDSSATLYTLLDNFLSRKKHWSRRAYELLTEDLEFTGDRYKIRTKRHTKLKEFVVDLDGKEITTGTLNLWIERTADGEDYKLMARKIEKKKPEKRRFPKSPANDPEAIPYFAQEIVSGLQRIGSFRSTDKPLIEYYLIWFSRDMLLGALSTVKSDYRGKIKKSVGRTFSHTLHCMAHERNLEWVKKCDTSCPCRPENIKNRF